MVYRLVFAGDDGQLYDHHSLRATGRTGDRFVELNGADLEKLPAGASLVLVPGGRPVGINRAGRFSLLERNPWREGQTWAVGALLPQGYTRTLLPSYHRTQEGKPVPLLGYAAVACRDGEMYVAACRTDNPHRWNPAHYDSCELPALVEKKVKKHPANRILRQLAHCALEYHCFTAQNIFYSRWEGGIPVSPACNAGCLGCISEQPAECCPSPQARIKYQPAPGEVAEIAAPHLQSGDGCMISFGQGCEGEPTLAAGTIAKAIEMIRGVTGQGTINMNSNAGFTAGVADICRVGLDAIRVTLISAREEIYQAYHRPQGFNLSDVCNSIRIAVSSGVYTSLNLLVLPGLTDREEETQALLEMVRDTGVNMIQLRNLNIDPDFLFQYVPAKGGEMLGIPAMIDILQKVPGLEIGSFSRPVR